ncbi:MAG TPA: hypothetical protein VEJ67_07240 [Candidatus Cybelea sp.]|nr:hypothetical protein [Candidatus Cybelea sp.]
MFGLLNPVLDDTSGVLKLYFTLSTGAVVLFINLLAQIRTGKIALTLPLALSIFSFGGASVLCFRVLWGLVRYRQILVHAIATEQTPDSVKKAMDAWNKRATRHLIWLQVLFLAGMVFGGLFVVAILCAR